MDQAEPRRRRKAAAEAANDAAHEAAKPTPVARGDPASRLSAPSRLPLHALRAFEAAARLGSMTLAGEELAVTHGAISRHVQALESLYGVRLLRRLPQSVEPTAEGAQLAAQLASAFSLIGTGIARLRPAPLTLSCSATIMQHWLIPRLGRFKGAHPGVELRLNVNYGEVDLLREEISVAIRNDMFEAPQDVILHPVAREDIGIVGAPSLLDRHRLDQPADLRALPLLATRTRPGAWQDWHEAMGLPHTALEPRDVFDHFYLLVQAAICGLGIAVVPRMIVEDELRHGRLAAPFGFVGGPFNMVLWVAPHLRGRSDLRALTDWLKAELAGPTPVASTPIPRG